MCAGCHATWWHPAVTFNYLQQQSWLCCAGHRVNLKAHRFRDLEMLLEQMHRNLPAWTLKGFNVAALLPFLKVEAYCSNDYRKIS